MVSSSLKVLLCLAAGAASEDVRRLQGVSLPPACLTACPSAQGWSDSMASLMTPPQGSQMPDLGAAMRGIFAGLCSVPTEAFACIANNANECVIPGSGGGASPVSTPSPAQYASLVGCLCNSCPGAGLAIGGFYGEFVNQLMAALQNIGGTQPTAQQQLEAGQMMLQATCPMVGAMTCMSDNSATCTAAIGLVSGIDNMDPPLDSDNTTAMCEAAGIPMTMPTSTTTVAETTSAASLVPGAGAAAVLLAMLL